MRLLRDARLPATIFCLLTPALGIAPLVACLNLPGDDLTVRCIDWRVSSGEERWIKAAAGDWFAVLRRGRVEEAVGVVLGVVRGAARDRRRGMFDEYRLGERRGQRCGEKDRGGVR